MAKKILAHKVIAIFSAIMLIISTIPVALVSATTDDVLVKKVYNISHDLNTYAIKEENIQLFDKNEGNSAYHGLGVKGRYGVKNSPSPNTRASLTWYSETGYDSFTVFTNNWVETNMAYLNTLESYKFSWSADNVEFTDIDTVADKGYTKISDNYYSYELCLTGIPKEARYICLTMICPQASFGWKYAINKVEYTYYAKAPSLTVKTDNGVELQNGGEADRNVIIGTKNLEKEQVKILKDGQPYEMPKGFLFTENGSYSITAENDANKGNPIVFSFEIKKPLLYKLSYSLTKDNLDGTYKREGNIVTEDKINENNYLSYYNGRYFTHLANVEGSKASFYWHSKSGFKSFTVFTKNYKDGVLDYLNLENSYRLYYSIDGVEFESLEYISLGSSASGNGYVSYELTAINIPDAAKYISLTMLSDEALKSWRLGLDGIAYEILFDKPQFNLKAKTVCGDVVLKNNGLSGSDVLLEYGFVSSNEVIVEKDGKSISLPENSIFTENGEYKISATNEMGTSSIYFTIKREDPKKYMSQYIFDGAEADTTAVYQSLISSPAIDNAPADFANGDGSVVINSESNLNDKWWSPEDGGSKLTSGKGSNYSENGYFYFKNSGSDGEKYSGIAFTYSVAAKDNFPKNQRIIISVSDSYDGNFTVVSPVSHTEIPTISGSMVKRFTDVYYLGGTDKIVKVEFKSNTLISARWHAAALAIFDLSKLQMPIITVKSDKNIENYGVTTENVNYSVTNCYNYEILRNGQSYTPNKEGVLDEDGDYIIKANNIVGECDWNFTIAKDSPAIVLRDNSGASIKSGTLQYENVDVTFYNSDKITVTRDEEVFEMPEDGILDLNGVYVITAEGKNNKKVVKTVTIARELPTVNVIDYDGKVLSNGVVSKTYIDVVVKNADSVIVKKNNSKISMPEENRFTENGNYSIEATNKAGTIVFGFVIDIAAPLKQMAHPGDKMEIINYDSNSNTSIYQYAVNFMNNNAFPASATEWIGINKSMLRPNTSPMKTSVIYRCVNIKSFGVWALLNPDITDLSSYKIYVASEYSDFKEIQYSIEYDESYISKGTPTKKGYGRYRLVANDIPAGINYVKVEIDSQHEMAHAYGIQKVEFSFNTADQGKINEAELKRIMSNCNDGDVIPMVLRNVSKPIPSGVFEAFMGYDATLKLIIVDDNLNPIFSYMINGTKIYQPGDLDISIKYNPSYKIGKYDDTRVFTTLKHGDWEMDVTFGAYMNGERYLEYYLYEIADGILNSPIKSFIDDGCVYFGIEADREYVLSKTKGLNKDADFISLLGLKFESSEDDLAFEDITDGSDTLTDNIEEVVLKENKKEDDEVLRYFSLPKTPAILLLTMMYAVTTICAILLLIAIKPKK